MNNHSELVRALRELFEGDRNEHKNDCYSCGLCDIGYAKLEAFILARDKKNAEPLIKLPKRSVDYGDSMHRLAVMQSEAIKATLKNLGAE